MQDINPHANPFLFSEHEVRTATDEHGAIWFCAKDVFDALEITWKGSDSLGGCPENWFMVRYLRTIKGEREMVFISEPAVYRVVFRSEKPNAVEFASWVCEEVLPTLRKQGYFGLTKDIDQIKSTNLLIRLLEQLQSTKDAFVFKLLERRLRNLCNAMGEPMPSIELLGKDRSQIPLL
ncbi:BRO-N domain-containing protein [Oceanobacter kriegii]|uniref:BRO-N domain-containing protein n=1 Tax=Oceanobacter kriegii TaxID=64972 RepID=UPI000688A47E|nr:BRO family protein [Oceanobacter kriegii]